jgi:AsmA protein
VQAAGRVRVGELKLGGTTLRSAVARFDLHQSVLALDPVVAQLHGADVDASVRIDAGASSPRIAVKGSVADLDTARLLGDVAPVRWLEGRAALSWDLVTSGTGFGAWRQALAGRVDGSVKGGALSGVDLRAALLEAKADLGKRGVAAVARAFNAAASTPFNELKLDARFNEGRAHARALELSASAVRTAGEGELVLDTGTLDLRLTATVAPKAPAELSALAGVTVPLHVTGPWRAPTFALDAGAASGDKVPRAADAAVASQSAEHDGARQPIALSAK